MKIRNLMIGLVCGGLISSALLAQDATSPATYETVATPHAPDTRLVLWDKVRLGMSPAEVQAYYPSYVDKGNGEFTYSLGSGSIEVYMLVHGKKYERHVVGVRVQGSGAGQAVAYLQGLTAKYGAPVDQSESVSAINPFRCKFYCQTEPQSYTYHWASKGLQIELTTQSDGSFGILYQAGADSEALPL